MTKEKLTLAVIERLKQEYPDADCTLDYDQAWKLLVSVRLAAQCTDARVNVVVEDLYAKYPDIDALANATPEEIEEIVQSYVEDVETPTIMAYLFDHPLYLVALIAGVLLFCLRRIMH